MAAAAVDTTRISGNAHQREMIDILNDKAIVVKKQQLKIAT
jgi:hypothetical protein